MRKSVPSWIIFLSLALFLGGLEFLLRVANFRYAPDVEFSYPRPADFARLKYDPKLFWTLNPEDAGVNAWGFLGKEVSVEKPSGTYRILFIGDSIMQAGYPLQVETCLHKAWDKEAEAIPLAVQGYSSYQGRLLAETYGKLLQPDLVVVQFGWNDHWLAFGEPDAEKSFSAPSAWNLKFHRVYDRVRTLQAVGWVWGVVLRQGNVLTGQMRVPPEDYRENLRDIQTLFEQEKVPVLFVTAPSAQDKFGVPSDLIERQFAWDVDSVLAHHQTYNQITREVAGKHLIDLATGFASLPKGELRQLFQQDGIHPTPVGTEEIASRVCAAIMEMFPSR